MRLGTKRTINLASVLLAVSIQQVRAEPMILNCQMGACFWSEVVASETLAVPDTNTNLTIVSARVRSFTTGHKGDYPTGYSKDLEISDETIGEVRAACSSLTPGLLDEDGQLTTIGVLQPYGYELSARSLYFLLCHNVSANVLSEDVVRSLGYTSDSRTDFPSLDDVILANASVTTEKVLPFYYKVIDVASNDVLNIRSAPDSNATIVGSIPYNASLVEITGASEDGKWFRLNIGEGSGWIRNRYLAPRGVPVFSNTDLPVGLRCLREEPFDVITFFVGLVRWDHQSLPDDTEMALKSVTTSVDPEGVRTSILVAEDKGGSVRFLGQERVCSSDSGRLYPYTFSLEADGGTSWYLGCCTLVK
ncbi:SH3 domain-containing protein [Tabrizicola sp.]|uniref:SH3 domain-containing protein n=1 Tax=Tabrizicola sp. TaxID=2005166 RepID=UPI002623B2EE|nr:SH3 domain-containing protein [Tabrizicola sp.]MDM7930891.1 SH3 domain-containing protein [Tabrizicola sp.]